MSDGDQNHGKHEIIIVKRRGGDHEGGHGGAWKIAYADFMTAMMAFFLVMWLVNAANEETKASVASYFNPIKLADEKPTEKGLKKPVDQAQGEKNQQKSDKPQEKPNDGKSAKTGEDLTSTSGDQTNYSEADFFENPYSVLAEIAQEVGQQANVSAKGEGGAAQSGPATGADGGQAYRDPFDPDFWTKQVQVSSASKKANEEQSAKSDQSPKGEVIALSKATAADIGQPADQPQTPEQQPTVSEQQAAGKAQEKQTQAQQLAKAGTQGGVSTPEDNAAVPANKDAQPTKAQQQEAKDLQQAIQAEIKGVVGQLAEGLQVTAAEGGVLVTISDQTNDPMFNIGSAVPRREMVLAMEKIGKLLAERQGAILIRGHTDGRPYMVGGRNDNWRLSLDRAQSAYYMLTSGGLDEKRVVQVSGFADRRLKLPDDPFNDANRRIEILIASPSTQAATDPAASGTQAPVKPASGKGKSGQGKQG
ncbi:MULTISPECIES: MotB family protein [Rhizobium]|uniref:Chemotaxis protein MotB n=1 Tax=Rhizobium tropici TaxID=398 RepID=A0A6P1BZR9_RHITR|nr:MULTISPECIES: MotB family protein [Rhizobium]AGB70088.1 chemotaxis motility protein MotB [Rhizobium tropici CIAT 899]MBB4239518.1 chemotaxis protein MotB [Rhizobium tropici]MBB5590788.1 chemotaxis protein MotB [Rhizobium tropici]MBB6490003.1 chemotaxis protein MotB [Rhizobium tropici]NEV09506.1 MotB family protein [Rhizobium tropici]